MKGSRHKTKNDLDVEDGVLPPGEEADEQLIHQFEQHSETYEN